MLTYLHADHLGSASLTTSASGVKTGELRYTPYGETRSTWGNVPTDKRCTGQREESALGVYDYGARMYDASLGRFISADSIVPEVGNPQSFNRYSYVLGNPLRYTDPSGHYTHDEWKEILGLNDEQFNTWWASLTHELQLALSGLEYGDILQFAYEKGICRLMLVNTSLSNVKNRYSSKMLSSDAEKSIYDNSTAGFWDLDFGESMDFLTGLSMAHISTAVDIINLGDSNHPCKGTIPYIQGQNEYIYADDEYREGTVQASKLGLSVWLFASSGSFGAWGPATRIVAAFLAGSEVLDLASDSGDFVVNLSDSANYKYNGPTPYLHNGTLEQMLKWQGILEYTH